MKSLKIIYAGTPDFAVPPLRALLASAHQLVAVYTQPDRPAGRGRKVIASPVKQLAVEASIRVLQPENFRSEASMLELEALDADLMIVAAYGLILPQRILDAPRLGCINIHASLLPRWRGAAPIQRAILANDPQSGITIMQMEAGLDTGPMLLKKSCPIEPDDTGGTLHDRLAEIGSSALMEALPHIIDGSIQPEPQANELANYAKKLEKSEAQIDWTDSAAAIDRRIRAFNPWPVAQCQLDDKVLRIWNSQALPDRPSEKTNHPGEVISSGKEGIDVQTGAGILRILQLQLPGKRAMDSTAFANSRNLEGTTLV